MQNYGSTNLLRFVSDHRLRQQYSPARPQVFSAGDAKYHGPGRSPGLRINKWRRALKVRQKGDTRAERYEHFCRSYRPDTIKYGYPGACAPGYRYFAPSVLQKQAPKPGLTRSDGCQTSACLFVLEPPDSDLTPGYRLASDGDVVAFKMNCRQGARSAQI